MPENILSKRLARWRSAYRNSGLRRFLEWWGSELAALLPQRVRDRFVERRGEILIERAVEGGWLLTRVPGIDEADRRALPVEATNDDWQGEVALLRERSEVPADLILILERRGVLDRHLTLPLAAEDNLAQVIAFEMDRQTPFKPDQVRFDHRITRRDPVARQIALDLLIAPRPVIDAATAPIIAAELPIDAIDIRGADGRRSGYNLLPLLKGEVTENPRKGFLYWSDDGDLMALREDAMRTSQATGAVAPTGSTMRSCSTRRSFV